MKPPCNDHQRLERGIALVLFTISLPVLLGLTVLAVDLGNLYLTRDKLNVLNRSASATAVNARALHGWAPLACTGTDPKLGYTCKTAVSGAPPKGEKYGELVNEIRNTILSQARTLFSDAVGTTATNDLMQYTLASETNWRNWQSVADSATPIYDLKEDKFQLKVRYAVRTLLLTRLASLFKVQFSSLCQQPTGTGLGQENRCWVETSDTISNSSSAPARVIMLLDTSGSMSTTVKQQALKTAAASFIDYFNPFRDQLGLIAFGTGVKPTPVEPRTFTAATDTRGFLDLKATVEALTMGGQTNPCDALVRAAKMVKPTTAPLRPTRTFVVLFTDGAPNVYRLSFCDPASSVSSCAMPGQLAPVATNARNDWYGWTVKWGRRDTYTAGDNPFYGAPKLKDGLGNTGFDTRPGITPDRPNLFRINERGEFMVRANTNANTPWCNMELPPSAASCEPSGTTSPVPPNMPFSRAFIDLSTADDNYLWNGPSYLVNWKNETAMGTVSNLIDRVDTTFNTCGPPNRPSTANDRDEYNYNHSLYFASRVVDRLWSLDRKLFGGTTIENEQAYLVRLRESSGSVAPTGRPGFAPARPDLTVKFYANATNPNPPNFNNGTQSPGCLDALDAQLPLDVPPSSPPKIFVGAGRASFWSNTTPDSIAVVGEVIKTAELPYYCAIRAADYLRKELKTTVFAVGLGVAAKDTYGENCNDPLQNALDFDRRKDFFLQRLSFAPEGIQFAQNQSKLSGATWKTGTDFGIAQRTLSNCTAHPLGRKSLSNGTIVPAQTVYLGFSEGCDANGTPPPNLAVTLVGEQCKDPRGKHALPSDFSEDAIGGYYPTNEAAKLKAHFGAIAKQILFRLSI